MAFNLIRTVLVDAVFSQFAEDVVIRVGNADVTVRGVYRGPESDLSAGELAIIGEAHYVRFKTPAIAAYSLPRATSIGVAGRYFVSLREPRVHDDGTSYVDLQEVQL